jgi:hypothetical protein
VAKVYSQRLAVLTGAGGGTTGLPAPAAGDLWVIRHMTVTHNASPSVALGGWSVNLAAIGALWSHDGPNVVPFRSYDWSGRHVIFDTDTWDFHSADAAAYSLLVSGYLLTLP